MYIGFLVLSMVRMYQKTMPEVWQEPGVSEFGGYVALADIPAEKGGVVRRGLPSTLDFLDGRFQFGSVNP